MNFKWKKIVERGQYGLGFVDVFELINENRAIAIIHYLPQHTHIPQRVLFTLLLEGEKKNWTDMTISNIFEDAENQVKNSEGFKFNNFNALDHMDTQIFMIKTIEGFDYMRHGDYAFPKSNNS